MRSTKWKYIKISRFSVEDLGEAKRTAPAGFKHCKTTVGEYKFRRPHGTYVREQAAIAAEQAALGTDEELHNLPAS